MYLGWSGLSLCAFVIICIHMIKGQCGDNLPGIENRDHEPQSITNLQSRKNGEGTQPTVSNTTNSAGYVTQRDFLIAIESQTKLTAELKELITMIGEKMAMLDGQIREIRESTMNSHRGSRPVYSRMI